VTSWVDSHCHLPPAEELGVVLARARDAGVVGMVCVGTDLESSLLAVGYATAEPDVVATVGLHPHDARRLDEQWPSLQALAREPGVVAVGETGFDLYYEHSPVDAQEEAFRRQIRLAHELGLTLVIHTRDAWDHTFRVLADEGVPARTIFHCWSGGPVEARRALEIGAYVSFSGIVTFKNADDVRAAAAVVPPERVLVETDAPFLAPVPHRGQPNEPAWVADVGAGLAAASGRDPSSIGALTRENAAVAFRHRF
jgi:TatD DNase family protein